LVAKAVFDGAHALDLGFKARAFLQDFLRALLILPERGIFGEGVQFREAMNGTIPVKDASSAGQERS
jgi:hypothetical protein